MNAVIGIFRSVGGVETADVIVPDRGLVGTIVRVQPDGPRRVVGQRTIAYDVTVDGKRRRVDVVGGDWRSARLVAHDVAREMASSSTNNHSSRDR